MKQMRVLLMSLSLLGLTACVSQHSGIQPANIANMKTNGLIIWANGIEQELLVSPSGSTLTFFEDSVLFANQGMLIFSRIDSARNGECEHYYNESVRTSRLTVCPNGEITRFEDGNVVNVGEFIRFEPVE
ncbi:hypothetical protein VST7929_01267 [Vibrio stylophorae]|uniref:Lipoprotein n=1 Tax=Vibrio stylophorae TaxID=659351 RepID=A0ABM8ZSW2_9VIBR|nr:hypothetical protein [Vibrio stylophorae]CAH0533401.1 hypothetical protein VST7929_01267 [Vibrio stylophorae]